MLCYIGPELDAAGWRLGGARVLTPAPGAEAQALAQARTQAALVLLAPAVAQALPPAVLDAALAAPQPLVMVLPAARGELAFDPAERVRRQLGIEVERDAAAETPA